MNIMDENLKRKNLRIHFVEDKKRAGERERERERERDCIHGLHVDT